MFFFSGRTTKNLTPPPYGLVVHATCRTSQNNIFIMQLPGEFSPFVEKKMVFCLVVGGVTPLPPLSGPTTKKTHFFLCVSSLREHVKK